MLEKSWSGMRVPQKVQELKKEGVLRSMANTLSTFGIRNLIECSLGVDRQWYESLGLDVSVFSIST